jgi:hypothetical protein
MGGASVQSHVLRIGTKVDFFPSAASIAKKVCQNGASGLIFPSFIFSSVKEKSTLNKSMLASKNLPKPITKASDGQHWIRVLAAELALRLNDARKESPTLWPKTIVLHARQGILPSYHQWMLTSDLLRIRDGTFQADSVPLLT